GRAMSRIQRPTCGHAEYDITICWAICAGSYCCGCTLRTNSAVMKRTAGEISNSSVAAIARFVLFMSLCTAKYMTDSSRSLAAEVLVENDGVARRAVGIERVVRDHTDARPAAALIKNFGALAAFCVQRQQRESGFAGALLDEFH